MVGERSGRAARYCLRFVFLLGLTPCLAGCGTSGGASNWFSSSALDFFSTSSKASTGGSGGDASATDVECPGVSVRSGASTLMIGSKPGEGEPSALDLRYQATIVRMARECQVNSGMMSMKVGVEGRVITGPAGGPGTIDLPLRIAIVREGVNPKTIASKLAQIQVTIASAAERVSFTHVDPEISFPLPQPISEIDGYVVYVGFDPSGTPQEKKKPTAKPKPKAVAKPRQS